MFPPNLAAVRVRPLVGRGTCCCRVLHLSAAPIRSAGFAVELAGRAAASLSACCASASWRWGQRSFLPLPPGRPEVVSLVAGRDCQSTVARRRGTRVPSAGSTRRSWLAIARPTKRGRNNPCPHLQDASARSPESDAAAAPAARDASAAAGGPLPLAGASAVRCGLGSGDAVVRSALGRPCDSGPRTPSCAGGWQWVYAPMRRS